MSQPWPPPPDLASIQELVRTADPEGHITEGAPADEYEPEEEAIFTAIRNFPTSELVAATLLPIIEKVWNESFPEGSADVSRPALRSLAEQIERFFGPEARPQTRQAS